MPSLSPATPRPALTTRAVLLGLVVLFLIGVVALFALRHPRVASLFRSDAVNAAEATQLQSATLTVPTSADDAGWPQWLGPNRDGHAPAGPFRTDWDKTPPQKLWEAPCGRGYGSLAVVGGKLYVHDRDGGHDAAATERVRCLDAATGKPLWEHAYPADYTMMDRAFANGPRTTPSVEGDRVYTVGATGLLLCVEAPAAPGGSPRELWRHDLLAEFDAKSPQWGVAGSPLIEGGLVIVQPGGTRGSVAAFDKATGELRWTAADNHNGYSSPIAATVVGKRVVFAMTANALLCVGLDGTVLATYKWVTRFDGNIATPIVVGDYVFISSDYNHGCALLRVEKDGAGLALKQVYFRNNKVMRNHHSNSVFVDGCLYGFDQETFKCVDFRSLEERWDARELSKGCVIVKDRHLIVLSQTGDLALVEATPEDFRLVAKLPSGLDGNRNWSLPVLVGGKLYLRDEQTILCLDVK